MWRDPYPRQGWGEWLIGWLFTLLLLAFIAEALAAMIRPLLPWLALAGLGLFMTSLWLRQRDRW